MGVAPRSAVRGAPVRLRALGARSRTFRGRTGMGRAIKSSVRWRSLEIKSAVRWRSLEIESAVRWRSLEIKSAVRWRSLEIESAVRWRSLEIKSAVRWHSLEIKSAVRWRSLEIESAVRWRSLEIKSAVRWRSLEIKSAGSLVFPGVREGGLRLGGGTSTLRGCRGFRFIPLRFVLFVTRQRGCSRSTRLVTMRSTLAPSLSAVLRWSSVPAGA